MNWNWLARLVSKRVRELEEQVWENKVYIKHLQNKEFEQIMGQKINLNIPETKEKKKGDLIWREDVKAVIKDVIHRTWNDFELFNFMNKEIDSIPAAESHDVFNKGTGEPTAYSPLQERLKYRIEQNKVLGKQNHELFLNNHNLEKELEKANGEIIDLKSEREYADKVLDEIPVISVGALEWVKKAKERLGRVDEAVKKYKDEQ